MHTGGSGREEHKPAPAAAIAGDQGRTPPGPCSRALTQAGASLLFGCRQGRGRGGGRRESGRRLQQLRRAGCAARAPMRSGQRQRAANAPHTLGSLLGRPLLLRLLAGAIRRSLAMPQACGGGRWGARSRLPPGRMHGRAGSKPAAIAAPCALCARSRYRCGHPQTQTAPLPSPTARRLERLCRRAASCRFAAAWARPRPSAGPPPGPR